jgi:hypothetical protein
MAACGSPEPGPQSEGEAPPKDTVLVQYGVGRSDQMGRASIRYRTPGGKEESREVTLPWRSEQFRFALDEKLFLEATSEPDDTANLQCVADTDQGPYGRSTASSGASSCRIDKSLADLARR